MRAFQPRQLERPRDVDQRPAGFGGETLAPVGTGDPVAQLDRAGRAPAKAAGADDARRAVGPLGDQEARHDRVARAGEEGLGVLQRIGPGRGREVAHDLLIGNRARQRGRILGPAGSSTAVDRYGRTSTLPSPLERPARAALFQFREKIETQQKREERGLPSSPFSRFRLLDLILGCPLRERPFIDRSLLFRRLRHNRFDVDVFAAELAVAETRRGRR